MVKAEIYYHEGRSKGFVISGHAETAEPGKDVVCAAISALSQTALLGLDAYLREKPIWKISDHGYLECWLPETLSAVDSEKAEVIIGALELGLRSIEKSYGQYLKVSKRRWTACCSK